MNKANNQHPGRKQPQVMVIIRIVVFFIAGIVAMLALSKKMGYSGNGEESLATELSQIKYPYSQVSKQRFGEGRLSYWIFQPQGSASSSVPKLAPVVLFLHGWMGVHPYIYGGWIDHLAKNGNIVIFPVYQTSKEDSTDQMLQSSIRATQNAVSRLKQSNSIRPDWNRFVIVGHSFGGGLSVQIAARAKEANLPIPKAIMPVAPGWRGSKAMPTEALKRIPASVLMWVIEGADDTLKGTRQGKAIYAATPQISIDHKIFILLSSNNYQSKVDHNAPLSPLNSYQDSSLSDRQRRRQRFNAALFNRATGMSDGRINTIDIKGYWPLFDQLCQTAFSGSKSVDSLFKSMSQNFVQISGTGTPSEPKELVIGF